MLSKKMLAGLNEQVNKEFYSAYFYLSMASYFHADSLDGFAGWMRKQATEETEHAMKIFDYINERNGRIELKSISTPDARWKSPLAAFEAAYEHEKSITGSIYDLVNLAGSEKDHATHQFLQWFVVEQVEEESNVGRVVDRLRMVKDSTTGRFILDRELGQRT